MCMYTELALVTHKPRAASAYAVGPSRCAGLSDIYLFIFPLTYLFADVLAYILNITNCVMENISFLPVTYKVYCE